MDLKCAVFRISKFDVFFKYLYTNNEQYSGTKHDVR